MLLLPLFSIGALPIADYGLAFLSYYEMLLKASFFISLVRYLASTISCNSF
jgi:hypothetical protein